MPKRTPVVKGRSVSAHIKLARKNVNVSDVLLKYANRKRLKPAEKSAITRTLNRFERLQREAASGPADRVAYVTVKGKSLENARKHGLTEKGLNIVAVNGRAAKGTRVRVDSKGRISTKAPKGATGYRDWKFEPVDWHRKTVAEDIADSFERSASRIFKRERNARVYLRSHSRLMLKLGGFEDAPSIGHEVKRWVDQYVVEAGKFDGEDGEPDWSKVEDVLWGFGYYNEDEDARELGYDPETGEVYEDEEPPAQPRARKSSGRSVKKRSPARRLVKKNSGKAKRKAPPARKARRHK